MTGVGPAPESVGEAVRPQDLGFHDGPEIWEGPVVDEPHEAPVLSRTDVFDGQVWNLRSDDVQVHEQIVRRDWIEHTGAVGVVAMDAEDRVLLIRQYRHPVAMMMFEPPAGLMDVDGESGLQTAQRELAEEAGLVAEEWHVLAEFCNSPGGSSEAFRCFLARGLSPLPGGRQHTGEAEEMHLPQAWVPLSEAVGLVLAGQVQNPATCVGILAAGVGAARGFADLRPADAPWPMREHLRSAGRLKPGD